MPKLYGFFSQEASDFLGDNSLYYYTLATTGVSVAITHISEDETGADYFWKDKVSLGEIIPKDTRRLWDPIPVRPRSNMSDLRSTTLLNYNQIQLEMDEQVFDYNQIQLEINRQVFEQLDQSAIPLTPESNQVTSSQVDNLLTDQFIDEYQEDQNNR